MNNETPQPVTTPAPNWQDQLDWNRPVSEDDVWQAIADANNLDYSEIADGDLADWI